jgi:hypothetical protein
MDTAAVVAAAILFEFVFGFAGTVAAGFTESDR